MHSYYESRLIKLISPGTNEVFSLELDGDEKELKELLATLINMPVTSIKGLRDSFGNYFTISSAIQNPNIPAYPNTFFTVVINNRGILNDNYCRQDSEQKKLSSGVLQSAATNSTGNFPDQKRHSTVVDHIDPLFENMSPIRKSNQLPLDCSNSSLVNAIDKYQQIALQMVNNKMIEEKQFNVLKKKLQEENEEVVSLFRKYTRSGMDTEKLHSSLIPLLNQGTKGHRDSIFERYTLTNVLDSLASAFENPNDLPLLQKLLKFDNDMILKAFEAYEFDNDKSKLVIALNSISKKYRGRVSESHNTEVINGNPPNIDGITSILDLKVVDSPEEKKKGKGENNKQFILDEMVQSIEQRLRFDLCALFCYEIESKGAEKVLMNDLQLTLNHKDSMPFDGIKQYYKTYFDEKIANEFSFQEKGIYKEIAKDNEERLKGLYAKFKQHKNLETLTNKIQMLLNKIDEEKEKDLHSSDDDEDEENEEDEEEEEDEEDSDAEFDENSDSMNSESSIDSENDNDNKKKKQMKDSNINQINRKGSKKKSEAAEETGVVNKKLDDFIKVINRMAFTEEVKKEILNLIKYKNEKMLKVFENFQRNKMSLTKNVLLQVVKECAQKPSSNNKTNDQQQKLKTQFPINKEQKTQYQTKQSEPSQTSPDTWESCMRNFLNLNQLSTKEYNVLVESFGNKDSLLNSFWELYLKDPSKEELYDSLKMYLDKGSTKKRLEGQDEQQGEKEEDVKDLTIEQKYELLLKKYSFSVLEKQLLNNEFQRQNDMLYSIIEGYQNEEYVEDAIDSLKILLSKLKHKNQ